MLKDLAIKLLQEMSNKMELNKPVHKDLHEIFNSKLLNKEHHRDLQGMLNRANSNKDLKHHLQEMLSIKLVIKLPPKDLQEIFQLNKENNKLILKDSN